MMASLHHRNIQTSPENTLHVFTQATNNHCNLKDITDFQTLLVRTVYNGTESISHLVPLICLGYCC